MGKIKILLLSALFAVFFVSCDDGDDPIPAINEAEVLVEYLESAASPLGKDFVSTDLPTIISATDVNSLNLTSQVYVIDIRSSTDFATGHIIGAHNVALGDVLSHIESTDLSAYTKVVIACYSGQTAGFATSLLRLLGYDNVFSLKWGMSSWHTDFAGAWNTAIASGNARATQFVSTATDKGAIGEMPTLSTGKTTGQEILEARVDAVFAEGYDPAKVTNTVVFDDSDNYYIINYWVTEHYDDPGHIPGAIQYTPKETLKFSVDLKTLPTDKKVAVYCYTGQTSSFVTAYLRVLGYDAKSILYGANGMIYDKLVEKSMTHFDSHYIMDYTYE